MTKIPAGYTEAEWEAELAKAAHVRALRKEGVLTGNQSADDIADLIPKPRSHAEIWRRFRASAKIGRGRDEAVKS